MRKLSYPAVAGYGVAVAVAGFALLVERVVGKGSEPNICPPFLAAVVIAAWFGGIGPGILVSVFAMGTAEWLFPLHSGHRTVPVRFDGMDIARLATYLMAAVLIGGLKRLLDRERRRLAAVVEQMPAGVVMIAADSSRTILCNRRVAEMLEKPPRVGEDFTQYIQGQAFHGDGRPYEAKEHPLIRSACTGEAVAAEEIGFIRKDGTRGVMVMNSAPILGPRGRIVAAVAAFHDMTASRRVAAAQRFVAEASVTLASSLDYEATLDRVVRLAVQTLGNLSAVLLVEEDGSLRRVAVACGEGINGGLAGEMMRRYLPRFEDPRGVVVQVVQSGRSVLQSEVTEEWLAGKAQDLEHFRILKALGLCSYMCVPLSTPRGCLGAVAFLSTRPQQRFDERDLALAEELARRAALAVENARLYRKMQLANAAKDRFLGVLSHEVRTPLTPVLMGARALEERADLPEDARAIAAMIRRNMELERHLIDDLLDLTRIVHGKLQVCVEPTDVHEAIRSALEICRAEAQAKGLELKADLVAEQHRMNGDPARLQQVFWNLLKNAVKFTQGGGRIAVRTWNEGPGPEAGSEEPGRRLLIEISDTGLGIEREKLPFLFTAFEQGSVEITRRFGGLGLGLVICKSLVESHGGRIRAASQGRDRGSCFTVDLPVADRVPDAAEEAPADLGLSPAQRLRVLLVEDHEDTARIMSSLLEGDNCQVQTAGSLRSAQEAMDRDRFDVLIADIGLPDGSGLDLLRPMQARGPVQGIALSGYGMEEDLRKSREAGFAVHLVKPVNMSKLRAALNQAIARAGVRADGDTVPRAE